MTLSIRKINSKDYNEIENIANESYSEDYYESDESFISKVEKFPDGCYVADLDGVVGYVISFPYYVGKSFPINTNYEIVENPNCWYIHDLCVVERFRNKGVAKTLAKEIIKKSWNVVALTAVQNSTSFWNKFGFLSFKIVNYCNQKADYMILIK
jgi:ribosomal protein S18 acetylase RimI-like enzyme